MPSSTHPISQAKGTPALSQAFVKRLHPDRNAGWKTGRAWPAGNLHLPSLASLSSQVSVLARTPLPWHSPALPLQRHSSSSHTMRTLPPPLQLPHPLNPQTGPDSQPLEWSKAENNHDLLPRQGRLDRQAALGCILVHTHVCTGTQTCTHACTHTETCTRTHPSLPPSITGAAPSIFCALALPR